MTSENSTYFPTTTSHFNFRFDQKKDYLFRHFKGFRGRLTLLILGKKAATNLMYDAAQCGWAIGYECKSNNIGKV